METIDLDLDEIFDQRDDGELAEDIAAPIQPEGDGDDQAQEETEGGEAQLNRLRDLSKGAAKKRVQRPQPKLDSERLQSNRGLPILPKIFEDVKFKGKGHEGADLQLMMGKLEHWAHRLFPKLPFDNFIERLEKLGSKKPVQNCVKRIRLDMPILDSDYITQFDEREDDDTDQAANKPVEEEKEMDAEEAFEQMIQQERELQKQKRGEDEDAEFLDGPSRPNLSSTMFFSQQSFSQSSQKANESRSESTGTHSTPAAQTKPSTPSSTLTEEQKAQIEKRKQLALEKRAARLGVPVSALITPRKQGENNIQSTGSSGIIDTDSKKRSDKDDCESISERGVKNVICDVGNDSPGTGDKDDSPDCTMETDDTAIADSVNSDMTKVNDNERVSAPSDDKTTGDAENSNCAIDVETGLTGTVTNDVNKRTAMSPVTVNPDHSRIDSLSSVGSDKMNGRTSLSSLSPMTDQEGPTLLNRLHCRKATDSLDMSIEMQSPAKGKENCLNMDKLNHNASEEEDLMGELQMDLDSESVALL